MKAPGKTPYEIRLEVLQLAQTILHMQHATQAPLFDKPKTAPTTEDIIAEAEKLNMFISKANQHNS